VTPHRAFSLAGNDFGTLNPVKKKFLPPLGVGGGRAVGLSRGGVYLLPV
jgi:hypothetical protein